MDELNLAIPDSVSKSMSRKYAVACSRNWNNQKLADAVLDAVEQDSVIDLIKIIDQFANETKKLRLETSDLKSNIQRLEQEKAMLTSENERLHKEQAKASRIKRRKSYDIAKIIETYMETNSLRKTGEICGCHQKTAKSILIENGIEVRNEHL